MKKVKMENKINQLEQKMTSSQINPAKAGGIPHGNEV